MRSLLILFVLVGLGYSSCSKQLIIDFYDQKLIFEYNKSVVLKKTFKANERDFKQYYESISKSDYRLLLNGLVSYRERYRLNDWLFYLLLDKVCSGLDKRKVNASYLKCFLLGKVGFRNRVTFSEDYVFIWLESDESVTGLRKLDKGYCINCGDLDFETHVFSRFSPFRNNKIKFSFSFNPLPAFSETNYTSKTFSLILPDSTYREVVVQFGSALISSLRDRKNFNVHQTFSVPTSETIQNLINVMSDIIRNYNDSVKVEYITSFVKENSSYLTDQEYFGKEKWMTPEEYLYYGSGDCEDRCSFTYYALRAILNKPLVIINYPNDQHVNIAISLQLKMKPNFVYEGKPYYVVEPSVIFGSLPLGKDDLVNRAKYELIGEYNPED